MNRNNIQRNVDFLIETYINSVSASKAAFYLNISLIKFYKYIDELNIIPIEIKFDKYYSLNDLNEIAMHIYKNKLKKQKDENETKTNI